MSSPSYRLDVQDPLAERQIRRIGAAVCLLWPRLSREVQTALIDEASKIYISGEDLPSGELETRLHAFIESGVVNRI